MLDHEVCARASATSALGDRTTRGQHRSALVPVVRGGRVAELPEGTVTFVFTDIEGSTKLLHELGERYADALADHKRLLREEFRAHGGVEVDTQGDAFFYAFARANDALVAAVTGQWALSSNTWPQGIEIRVRMGIHTGEPTLSDEGYVGSDVHLGARICAVAWGGQVVVSSATAALVGGEADEISLRSLGEHALKDIEERTELHQVVAAGLRDEFPALRSVSPHPTNLPARLPALIGREADIRAVAELLSSEDASVVTLLGPGGTGKTRLALAVGAEALPSFPDGVFFVDLSALTDPSLVVPAIAQALSLREAPGRSVAETLADYLSSKEMLLILDNFEHLLEAAGEVSSLMVSSAALRVLVTSREALRIEGEREFPLSPLALPASGDEPEEILSSPAVQLFVTKARTVRPGLFVSDEDASFVAEICRRLDGLPLAIELAATRVKVLSLPALASRLENSLAALGSGRRDASARQKTLQGAIAWSYGLLDEDEQRLFARLAVFAGGWNLEAAEAVCDRDDLSLDVLDGIASLVDKSLVRMGEGDKGRFSMLETIRSYARERLEESGDAEEIARAHAEYFGGLAEEAEPHTAQGDEQMEWLQRLEQELDNLRAALESFAELGEGESQLRMAVALRHFWRFHGHLVEGRKRLQSALEGGTVDEVLRARALAPLGLIAHSQGDYDSARAYLEEALDIEKRNNLKERVAGTLNDLGRVAKAQGDHQGARKLYEETIRIARQVDDVFLVMLGTHNLADLALNQEDFEQASFLSAESLRLWRKLGDAEGIAMSLANGAFAALSLNRLTEATGMLSDSLAVAKELGSAEILAVCIGGFASIAASSGQTERAARLLGAAERLRQSIGITNEGFEAKLEETTVFLISAELEKARFAEALEEGRALTAEEAIVEALEMNRNAN